MIKVMFVCLGNICRSPMAEFMFCDLIEKRGTANRFYVSSAGTSNEEEGNPVHRGTVKKMLAEGVPMRPHRATALRASDYGDYDYFVGMDEGNVRRMKRMFSGDPDNKVFKLLDCTEYPRDIADPWYTGDFDATYDDLKTGLESLYEKITSANI